MNTQDRINELIDKKNELLMKRDDIDAEINEIDEIVEDLRDSQPMHERYADEAPAHYQNAIRANIRHRM